MINSNYSSTMHHFWHIWYQKHCNLENRVRGLSRSSKLWRWQI